MTGFVFTFSLFCTAVLNTDPAVLQRAELAAVRQIIEAVIPEARLHRVLGKGQTQPLFTNTLPPGHRSRYSLPKRRFEVHSASPFPVCRFLIARPIRAPAEM